MAGIKPIFLPLKAEGLTIEAIIPYLPYVFSIFSQNRLAIEHYRNIYRNNHAIYAKKRPHDDDSTINNIIAVPHLWAMVNFKSGYAVGNPKEYSQNQDKQTDDINYLNKYCKDAKIRSVDKDVITEVYTVGSCYYFVEPKKDIKDLDLSYQSPFNVWCSESDTCAKVYSSYKGNEELFDILVTKMLPKEYPSDLPTETVISIYLPNDYYEVTTSNGLDFTLDEARHETRAVYKMLPLVEKYANKSRIGIVEIGETIQDAIDRIFSNEVDNVEDVVNEMMIFLNCILGKTQEDEAAFLRIAKKNGVIVLNSPNPDIEADVKTISTKLDHSSILSIIEVLKSELYSTCGVPLATSDTSNGNNKAGALQLGNGWENAYDRLLDDINSFTEADYNVLERMLFICRKVANSRVNELNASEIDIKYNPNMSDNMQTKAQAFKEFTDCGVPAEIAIGWVRLSNDPITQGRMIEEYRAKQKQSEQETAAPTGDVIEQTVMS